MCLWCTHTHTTSSHVYITPCLAHVPPLRLPSIEQVLWERHVFATLPGFFLGVYAWLGRAGPLAGCAPERSSGRPRCWAAVGAGGSPPSPEPRGPAWSTVGDQVRSAPDPKTHTFKADHNESLLLNNSHHVLQYMWLTCGGKRWPCIIHKFTVLTSVYEHRNSNLL